MNEQVFLHVIDLTPVPVKKEMGDGDVFASSHPSPHVVTGLDFTGVRRLEAQDFEVTHSTTNDPRVSILTAASEAEKVARETNHGDATSKTRFETRSSWWDMVLGVYGD